MKRPLKSAVYPLAMHMFSLRHVQLSFIFLFFPTRFDNLESWRRYVGKTQIIDTYIGIYSFSFYK